MRELLTTLPKPSHYAGCEDGACRKEPSSVRLHVGLAFPDTYEVGMSYLGQKILYGIINAHEGWWAERVMAPEREAGTILRARGAPLCTLESDTPLANLHCLSFSITHELCYTNVLYMLDLAGIPLRTSARCQSLDDCPLVIAGGGALLSAEPLSPFVDIMVLGDGEESLPEFLRLLELARDRGWPRSRLLHEARLISGVYVPSLFATQPEGPPKPLVEDYTRPSRRVVANLDNAAYPTKQVIPVGAVHNRLSLEIARGCTRGCRYCHAGMVYRPVRERSLANIESLLDRCLRDTGFEEVSFLSLSSGDFSALKTLCDSTLARCARGQIGFSLPSQRVGSIDDGIMERISGIRRTGMTLAPEAGSQRLRDVINKGVTEEELLIHVQKLLEHGWRHVKLYFMIGLPTETDEDLTAIAELCCKVRDAAGRGGPRMQVTAGISPFVPKPFTPFQWEAQIDQQEMARRVHLLLTLFKRQKSLKLRWHEPAMSFLEGVLSRAGRQMADVVEKAYRKGAIFCSWMEGFNLSPWLEALDECGIDPATCTGARQPGAALPWGHLEAGISEAFLLRERERALAGKGTGDCRFGACHQCGVCDTPLAPSRLRGAHDGTDAPRIGNRLIFGQRDQKGNAVRRDSEGRLICRNLSDRPPRINAGLTRKAAQYRIWHVKTGGSAFLSQLELQAVLERALRRAAMPLSFSQGFHPLPLISFGRALPVGVESAAEWFAMTLHTALEPLEVLHRLSDSLSTSLKVFHVEAVDGSARTLQSAAEEFSLSLSTREEFSTAARCFTVFAGQDSHEYAYETKKGTKSLDIRPLLGHWKACADSVTFVLDWRKSYVSPVRFCLAVLREMGAEDAVRPRIRLRKTAQLFGNAERFPRTGEPLQPRIGA